MNRWEKIKETVGSDGQPTPDRLPTKKQSRRAKIKQAQTTTSTTNDERDEFGQPTYKGTMILPDMDTATKRALNALVQQGTQDSGEIVIPNNLKGQSLPPKSRILPQTEPKSDHLLIKSIQLSKDMKTGSWFFGEIDTNQGTFALGPEHNAQLNQKMLKDFALYLKDIFEHDLQQYISLDKDQT